MRIIIAPDSFKGSLKAIEAARAVKEGITRVFPDCICDLIPVADGGEGTVEAMVSATGGEIVEKEVHGPLMEKIKGAFGVLGDGKTAVIEMASASGLPLVPPEKRNPLVTSTYGTGQLILKALDMGCRDFVIGIGGSATVDGGTGMASALGIRFLDREGKPIPAGGGGLDRLHSIDMSGLDSRAKDARFRVACDVDNPLCGPKGAARIFGPQKGATSEMVEILDKNLEHYSKVVQQITGKNVRDYPGAGAAGGLGAGLMAFLDATLQPGVDIVLEAVDFENRVKGADLVVTGEGKIDGQTLHGKAPLGVARRAAKYGIPVVAIAGCIGNDTEKLYSDGFSAIIGICTGPMNLEDAVNNAGRLVADAAERTMRLINLGSEVLF
ncbi:MAG: glycerate kinase [Bacillota bacterium]|nr:glycerate kinase [Bacillota bacterium]